MSLLLHPNIKISEFEAAHNVEEVKQDRFLIQCEHLNYVVSRPVKVLIEALLKSQSLNIQLNESYFSLCNKNLSDEEVAARAYEHIPSELFAVTEISDQKMPFILSITLLPERVLMPVTKKLTPLFSKWIVIFMTLLFTATHGSLLSKITQFSTSGLSLSDGFQFIVLMLLSYFIHELGHVTACRRYDCPHGDIGMGIYFVFPVFYADVSKAWRLKRNQRATVDLGGLYFQAILLIIIDIYAYLNNSALAFMLSWTITLTMLHTLNPFFKFDGYWLLSDLSGITNLHEKMRSALISLKNKLIHNKPLGIEQDKTLYILIPYSLLTILFFVYVASFLFRKLVNTSHELSDIVNDAPVQGLLDTLSYIILNDNIFTFLQGVLWVVLSCLLLTFYIKRISGLLYSKSN
jgi:putative peptide zinc metalloprotease protein